MRQDDHGISLSNFVAGLWSNGADPMASDKPESDSPAFDASNESVEQWNAAVTSIAEDGPNSGPSANDAPPDATGAAGGSVSVLSADDTFWFDANQGANDHSVADDGADVVTDSFSPGFDGVPGHFDSVIASATFTEANSGSAGPSADSIFASNTGGAHFGDADAGDVVGNTPSFAYFPGSVPQFGGTPSDVAASSPRSAAPILAWVGDTGAGTGGGTGSGDGGSAVHANTAASSGLVINVVYDSSVNNAPAGFKTAVAEVVSYFESHFSNPVTITIDVGYGEIAGQSLGSNALGESETYLTSVSYAQLQSALANNANAIGLAAAAASLPATSPVNGQFWVSTAEAKALGITGASSSVDGYVGFSAGANLFAYDDSNGVPANQYDFFGVVAHEFSEVMGRQMMDGENFAGTTSYEPLDLFHYSAPGVRDFSGTTAGYASADGGKNNLDNFNTNPGGDFGDWAASAGHDSFLAFTGPGAVDAVTASDLTLMNLLGWDPASAPSAGTPTVTVHLVHDTGSSSSDLITSNDALAGTADANAVVTLTSGATVLGSTAANAGGVWSFTPSGLADGQYTIAASETNSAGNTGTASLTFTLDTTAPIVTSAAVSGSTISGCAGTLNAGQTVALTIGLSEAVTVSGGVPTLMLNDGGTATYDAAHSSAKSLVFDYTVVAGQYASALAVTGINLHSTIVADVAGNAANLGGADVTFSHLLVDATTPVAAADHAHDTRGGSISVSHAQAATGGVLANDSDSDPADVLSVSAVNGSAANVGGSVAGAYGTLTLISDGSYTYTNTNSGGVTAAGGVAEDIFKYTVSNGHGGMAASTLTVLITSPGENYVSGAHGSTIHGGTGSYVLDGSAGNMNVTAGGGGAQWLAGGPGDTLTGGSSADTFMFAPSFGKETINNFNAAQDVIDLPQNLFANFAAVAADMHFSGANTVITLDANDAITLSHVAIWNLHAQNFHFVL